MSAQTKDYVLRLVNLKPGERSFLRTHAGQGLDESVHGFDLFAGIWWPLRQKGPHTPRREVAWLVAKLHAACPLEHRDGEEFHLARQLARCVPPEHEEQGKARKRFIRRFDRMLRTPLRQLEPDLIWALNELRERNLPLDLDWVTLTDQVSHWERTQQRYKWSQIFTTSLTGEQHAD